MLLYLETHRNAIVDAIKIRVEPGDVYYCWKERRSHRTMGVVQLYARVPATPGASCLFNFHRMGYTEAGIGHDSTFIPSLSTLWQCQCTLSRSLLTALVMQNMIHRVNVANARMWSGVCLQIQHETAK